MRVDILIILIISLSLTSQITTQELPRHATIRLDITVGDGDFLLTDTMIEQTLMQMLHIINKNLKEGLGVHVQFAGWGKTRLKAAPGQGLAEYSKMLTSASEGKGKRNYYDNNMFRMFLVKGDFTERFTTSGLGNGCQRNGHSAIAITSDTSENARNMERALLMDMGIVNSAACSCENCILNPDSDSFVIPDCAREVLKKNLQAYQLSCLTQEPQVAWTKKAICGNGLVEGNEECDCWAADTECSKSCMEACCTTEESCKSSDNIDTPQPKPVPPPGKVEPYPPSGPGVKDGGAEQTRSTQSNAALPQSTSVRIAPQKTGTSQSGNLKWYIIGGVIAVVLLLLILAAIIAAKLLRKKRSAPEKPSLAQGGISKMSKGPRSEMSATSASPGSSGGATEFFK